MPTTSPAISTHVFNGLFPDEPDGPRYGRERTLQELERDGSRPSVKTLLKWEREGCVYLGGRKLTPRKLRSPATGVRTTTYTVADVEQIKAEQVKPFPERMVDPKGIAWLSLDKTASDLDQSELTIRTWSKEGQICPLIGRAPKRKPVVQRDGGRRFYYLESDVRAIEAAKATAHPKDANPEELDWLTAEQANREFGYCGSSIRRWAGRGEPPSVIRRKPASTPAWKPACPHLASGKLRWQESVAGDGGPLLLYSREDLEEIWNARNPDEPFDGVYRGVTGTPRNVQAAAAFLGVTDVCVRNYRRKCDYHHKDRLPSELRARPGMPWRHEYTFLEDDLVIVRDTMRADAARGEIRVRAGWLPVYKILNQHGIYSPHPVAEAALQDWAEVGFIHLDVVTVQREGMTWRVRLYNPQDISEFLAGRRLLDAATGVSDSPDDKGTILAAPETPSTIEPRTQARTRKKRAEQKHHLWAEWKNAGMSYAAIAIRWNDENPGDEVTEDAVKKALKRLRARESVG